MFDKMFEVFFLFSKQIVIVNWFEKDTSEVT